MSYFDSLTPQQQAFVLHYCTCFATGAAARKAGVRSDTGAMWMKTPEVLGAIEEKISERNQRLEIDADWVLMQLLQSYNADIAEIYDVKTNAMLPIHDWPEHWRKLAVGVKTRELHETIDGIRIPVGHVVDAKFPSKDKLIELLGKHIGVRAFTEQVTMAMDSDLANRLAKGRKRLNERNGKRSNKSDDADDQEISFL